MPSTTISSKKENILEIISEKLEAFSKKKESLIKEIETKKEQSVEIKAIILEQQETLNSTEIQISESEQEVQKLEIIIQEIQQGYDSIVESGNCLMSIVKNAE
jgi:chromosome segregation ATPase